MNNVSLDPRAQTRPVPNDVFRRIVKWKSRKYSGEIAEAITDPTRQAVLASSPQHIFSARNDLTFVSIFLAWCWLVGLGNQLVDVFRPEHIDRYVETGYEGTNGSRRTVREALYRIGRVVAPLNGWAPPRIRYGATPAVDPYSDQELSQLKVAARHQRTDLRCQIAWALLALGAGCGLDGRWLHLISGTDVARGDRWIGVRVGSPVRLVVCLSEWEAHLDDVVRAAGDGLLLGSRSRMNNLVCALEVPDGSAPFSLPRLRATWIVRHLSLNTPLPVLVEAAGVTNANPFSRYLKFVPPVAQDVAIEAMRGAK